MIPCAIDGCGRSRAFRNGLCSMHHQRLRRNGDLLKRRRLGVLDFPMVEREPRLSRQEALLVRELARYGGVVTWPVLAAVIGVEGSAQVGATVQRIRYKFGADVIVGVRSSEGGYMLQRERVIA